ncbi:hypothetical protein Noc_1137 [Nitrosococcus oceani ATCC 19707]|uniref:Uncharacterized protein n=2 Tax=Nitrosococcus oceani TaxID=1229 RepID=Q3JC05_NITOC|nr:hypothetical protein [Nitrosococcus oceani]ABA57641.1 hypothetical protein Noc_1137 [Nitrosococcus oceani ATCC 19707]EDZ68261.1 hypothetical protein NOC27_1588 [Nitrosococcus oceani AFC27]KFI19928.1 hypothetical protein IB75_05895 [Nitrosococcus oceani C-27]GEM19282.1 hypothetical protein NONS58_06620 [Nitrosococcus oceani]
MPAGGPFADMLKFRGNKEISDQINTTISRLAEKRGKKTKETLDLVIYKKKYKTDLIPPILIIAHYFVRERTAIGAQIIAEMKRVTQGARWSGQGAGKALRRVAAATHPGSHYPLGTGG